MPCDNWFSSSNSSDWNCQPGNMVRIDRCCCCSVKTGSIVLGALLLVGSVMNIGNSVSDILKGGNEVDWREDLGFSIGQNRKFNNIMFYFSLVGVVLSFITIIISSLLIYGVSKENPKLIKPMVVFLPLDSAIRLLFICFLSINIGLLHPLSLFVNFLMFFGMIFDIFVLLCIYSHYQQLNERSNGYSGNEMKPV